MGFEILGSDGGVFAELWKVGEKWHIDGYFTVAGSFLDQRFLTGKSVVQMLCGHTLTAQVEVALEEEGRSFHVSSLADEDTPLVLASLVALAEAEALQHHGVG